MRIIGMSVVGSGEADRWLDKTLANLHALCDDAVIALCSADAKTKRMVRDSGFQYYEDNREWGKYQPRIKTDLLATVAQNEPDWILPIDADEVMDATREDLERLAGAGHYAYHFYVVNLWNDDEHFWKEGSFWNVRFFKYEPKFGLKFTNKNVHCGWAPPFFYQWGWYAPHLLLHRGLMREEDRAKKVERYKKYDPSHDKIGMGQYYAALECNSSGTPFDISRWRERVLEEVKRFKPRESEPMDKQRKYNRFHAMRRPKDGVVISDIRDQDVERKKSEGWEYIKEVTPTSPTTEHSEVTTPKTTSRKRSSAKGARSTTTKKAVTSRSTRKDQ